MSKKMIEELRQLTAKAIQQGKEEAEAATLLAKQKEEARLQEVALKAKGSLNKFPPEPARKHRLADPMLLSWA